MAKQPEKKPEAEALIESIQKEITWATTPHLVMADYVVAVAERLSQGLSLNPEQVLNAAVTLVLDLFAYKQEEISEDEDED